MSRRGQTDEERRVLWEKPDPNKDKPSALTQFGHWSKRVLGINVAKWQRNISIGLLLVIVYLLMNPTQTPVQPVKTDLDPTAKPVAWALTEQWLKQKPLGENARIISWNGAQTVRTKDGSDESTASVNTLIVDSSLGWWRVQATIRPDGTLAGWPAAERIMITNTATPNANNDWVNALGSLQPSQALSTLITQWSTALMGSDSDALTVLIGDPNPNAAYQALGLGVVENATIEKASYASIGVLDKNEAKSDHALLRVTITLKGRGAQDVQTQFTYDVTVVNPDGTPKILAWGAPGLAEQLTDYSNRLPSGSKPVDVKTDANTVSSTDSSGKNGDGK